MNEADGNIQREISSLRAVLRKLRGENGCPWDREQRLDDIISYMIDESYELLQAEKRDDPERLAEELGDVLFLVVFAHELFLERKKVSLAEIVSSVRRKIINRHPHVFGEAKAETSSDSIAEWDKIKRDERAEKNKRSEGTNMGDFEGLPPLRKALAVQKEAAVMGFDWDNPRDVLTKLKEEISELDAELKKRVPDRDRVKNEVGDLFFTIMNIARKLSVDPENALELTTRKFMERFSRMEEEAKNMGRNLVDMPLDEQEKLWIKAKKNEK